ncbi:MAG: PLP-dependent aminotransferase family protein [Bacillota bacterium]|nr:PLP-dependent aminotransferase family protein [Bacillota bacterium]
MDYRLTTRMEGAQASIIRELLKMAALPGMISFGGGAPDYRGFPKEFVKQVADDAFTNQSKSVLGYGISEGYPPFVESLKKHLQDKEKLDFAENEVLILSGGQQCADLTAKLFVNEGDTVLVENPSFVGVMNAFRSYGANLKSIPLEEDGVDLTALEDAFKAGPVSLFYMISTFQNPSGITTSGAKRKAVYELAKKYDVIVFEDNPYGELRYEGEWIPAMKTLDTDGRVIYTGSFSKTIAPGMRIGFLVYAKALHTKFKIAKQAVDVHSSTLYQMVCHEMLTKDLYDSHVSAQRAGYYKKMKLMDEAMKACFHPDMTWHRPEGGLFIQTKLPEGMDSLPFVNEAVKRKVITVPGSAFLTNQEDKSNAIRLNFSLPSEEDIEKGVEILGKLSYEILG